MPSQSRLKRLFPVALSPAALADALQISRRKIDAAIRFEGLPVYRSGLARRVLIEDACDWIRRAWNKER